MPEPEPPQKNGEEAGKPLGPVNWGKVVALAAVIVCIALGLTFVVFRAISVGIESVAPKAANLLAPGEGTPLDGGVKVEREPQPEDVPRVPGL